METNHIWTESILELTLITQWYAKTQTFATCIQDQIKTTDSGQHLKSLL